MNRRGLLTRLFLAPLAAPAAVAEVAASGVVAGALPDEPIVRHDPVADLFYKHRARAERRNEQRRRTVEYMPAHVATKKSWSPAFKAHVLAQEEREFDRLWGHYGSLDPEDMLRVLREIGEKVG